CDLQRADALDVSREALVAKAIHGDLILTDHHRLGLDALGTGLDLLAVHVRNGTHQLLHRGDEGTGIHRVTRHRERLVTVTKHQNLRGCQHASAPPSDWDAGSLLVAGWCVGRIY